MSLFELPSSASRRQRTALVWLGRDRRGVAASEFALLLPLMVAFGLGVIEVSRYLLLDMRLDQAATLVADLATRDGTLSVAQVDDIFAAVEQVMLPFHLGSDGVVVLSGVGSLDGHPHITWQQRGAGSGSSELAQAVGEPADLPPQLQLTEAQTLVLVEVFYTYSPLLSGIMQPQTIVKRAFMRPRIGELATLQP